MNVSNFRKCMCCGKLTDTTISYEAPPVTTKHGPEWMGIKELIICPACRKEWGDKFCINNGDSQEVIDAKITAGNKWMFDRVLEQKRKEESNGRDGAPRRLASHHILRRNRIIDNLIHQFSMEDAKLPIETPNFKQFCKYMQSCAEFMKNCDYQGELWSSLKTMGSYVDHIRKDMIGKTDIVFMKQKFPKEYELARRCKNLQHSLRNLSVSLRMYPNEMPGKYAALPKKGRPEKLKMFEIKGMHETVDHGHFCYCDYFSGKDLREAMTRFFDKFPATDEIIYAHEYKGGPR